MKDKIYSDVADAQIRTDQNLSDQSLGKDDVRINRRRLGIAFIVADRQQPLLQNQNVIWRVRIADDNAFTVDRYRIVHRSLNASSRCIPYAV